MTELTRAQESGYKSVLALPAALVLVSDLYSTSLLDGQLKYHERRAKIASKVVKYPNVQDYRLALVRCRSNPTLRRQLIPTLRWLRESMTGRHSGSFDNTSSVRPLF